MSSVHANERPTRGRGLASNDVARRGSHIDLTKELVGQLSSCLVLTAQNGNEVHELSRSLETREQEVLFELLAVILDEATDDARRSLERGGRRLLARSLQAPDS